MAIADYVVKIHHLNSPAPIAEVPAENLQYSYVLNGPGSVGFVLPTRHEKCTKEILDPGKREIYVHRNGEKVWGGFLWTAQVEEGAETVRFAGEGWFSKFRRRRILIDKIYTNVDQFAIAWALIEYAQSYLTSGEPQPIFDLGITRFSSVLSGVLRTRTYLGVEYKEIGEALAQLAAVRNGFDFEITPDKRWKTYYPLKSSGIVPIFEYGKNIRSYGYTLDASKLANYIIAIGSDVVGLAEDIASATQFGYLMDTRSFSSVIRQDTIDAHAREELRLAKIPQEQLQLQIYTDDPAFGAYAVGDLARVTIEHGYINLKQVSKRITAINVQVSNEGNESFGVFFGEEEQEGANADGTAVGTTIREGNLLTTDTGSPTNEGTNKRLDAIEGVAWTGRVPASTGLVTVRPFFWVEGSSNTNRITFRVRVRRTSGTPADIVSSTQEYKMPGPQQNLYGRLVAQFISDGSTYSYIVEIVNLTGTDPKAVIVDYIKEVVQT